MKRLIMSVSFVLVFFFISTSTVYAITNDYSQEDIFDFLREARDKQWSTNGPFETRQELEDAFSEHFLKEFRDYFINHMYNDQMGDWRIIPTDALVGFIPEYSYNEETKITYNENEIIVSEHFSREDGPMIRPPGTRTVTLVSTSDGLRVKQVNGKPEYSPLFRDVEKDYYAYDEITYLTEQGVVGGYPDGTFRPNDHLKRGQAVVMMARALDWAPSSSTADFSDVDRDDDAADAIAYASSHGVLHGYPDGTFRPNATITRAQMAAILGNAFSIGTDVTPVFQDVTKETTGYGEINQLYMLGILSGYEENALFKPNQPLTRAQFAIVLSRLLDEDLRLKESQ